MEKDHQNRRRDRERRRNSHEDEDRDKDRDRNRRDRSRDRDKRDRSRDRDRRDRSRDRDRHKRDEKKNSRPAKREEGEGGFGQRPRGEDLGPQSGEAEADPKEGPDFAVSGKLLEDTNTYKGVIIKYSEPQEAKKPKKRWRFYVFKGEETLPVLHIHRQSAFLMGKDRKVVDLPIDHPSCSRQHAVLQYRMIKRDGMNRVLPYIIDLGSSNGTFLNNKKIEAQKYHELREKDVLKFGYSSREYVLLHDNSKDSDSD